MDVNFIIARQCGGKKKAVVSRLAMRNEAA